MNKAKFILIARILVSLFLLALLFCMARENSSKIWQLLSAVNTSCFILAFLMFLVSILFMAWRLKIALAAQDADFGIKDTFPLTLIGYFFTNFMPSSVGGDLVKGYCISKRLKTKLASYTSVFVDRLIGMFSLISIASIALLFTRKEVEHKFVFWTIGLMFSFSVLFIFLLKNNKVLKKIVNAFRLLRLFQLLKIDALLKKIYTSVDMYANQQKRVLQMFILSLVAQCIVFFAIYLLANSLCAQVPFGKVLLVMPIIFTLCMLPVTMNGLGLREWGFVFFLTPNIGEAAALSLSFLYLAMFLLVSILGGIAYLFWR